MSDDIKTDQNEGEDNLGNVLNIVKESDDSKLEDYQTRDRRGRKVILTELEDDSIMNKEF
ncbi:MAG: hypothetical protein WC570_00805 [Patescibacteria group bacterium]